MARAVRHSMTTYPRCPACGYSLRGNISGRCPECGLPINQELITLGNAETIFTRIRELQNGILALTGGIVALPSIILLALFMPLAILPFIPIAYGLIELSGVFAWRLRGRSTRVLQSVGHVDQKRFAFWFKSAIFAVVFGGIAGPIWFLVFLRLIGN